jgi:hypothetical protein
MAPRYRDKHLKDLPEEILRKIYGMYLIMRAQLVHQKLTVSNNVERTHVSVSVQGHMAGVALSCKYTYATRIE